MAIELDRKQILKRLQTHFQYTNEEFEDICEEYNVAIEEAQSMATAQGWSPRDPKDLTQGGVTDFFVEARRELSVQAVRYARASADKLMYIEARLIQILEKVIEKTAKLSPEYIKSMDIVRYSKILNELKTNNIMLVDALKIPSSNDPDRVIDETDAEMIVEVIRTIKRVQETRQGGSDDNTKEQLPEESPQCEGSDPSDQGTERVSEETDGRD